MGMPEICLVVSPGLTRDGRRLSKVWPKIFQSKQNAILTTLNVNRMETMMFL